MSTEILRNISAKLTLSLLVAKIRDQKIKPFKLLHSERDPTA